MGAGSWAPRGAGSPPVHSSLGARSAHVVLANDLERRCPLKPRGARQPQDRSGRAPAAPGANRDQRPGDEARVLHALREQARDGKEVQKLSTTHSTNSTSATQTTARVEHQKSRVVNTRSSYGPAHGAVDSQRDRQRINAKRATLVSRTVLGRASAIAREPALVDERAAGNRNARSSINHARLHGRGSSSPSDGASIQLCCVTALWSRQPEADRVTRGELEQQKRDERDPRNVGKNWSRRRPT